MCYNDTTQLPVPGGVATGVGGLGEAAGVAVAPDGSFYVSSDTTGQVLHFNYAGDYLGYLGEGDADPAPLADPGTLAFGPNGDLYVADRGANAIFQFDTSLTMQQYLSVDTLLLPAGFTPGGFTFAADSTRDLIVGDLTDQSVQSYDGSTWTTLDLGGGVNAVALVTEANGNLLIADVGGKSGNDQILQDTLDAPTPTTTQLIGPLVLGSTQPTSMLLDTDGNLLVGLSSGAVEKFDIQSGALIGTIATGVRDPSGMALAAVPPSDIAFSTFFDTNGSSVLRYSDTTDLPVTGSIAAGSGGLSAAAGLAVAPDGSYYVSSQGEYSGQVLHFSSSGAFLGVLGANDAPQLAVGLSWDAGLRSRRQSLCGGPRQQRHLPVRHHVHHAAISGRRHALVADRVYARRIHLCR